VNARRAAGWAALLIVVAAVTAARLALFAAGPDLDSDSYGHAVIGRTLLLAPTDVRQHWVWLPLWQYVFTALALVGRGLEEVRLANVALSAVAPLLLARTIELSPSVRDNPRFAVVPYFAGALASLWPLAIDHGQAGEPEPLFLALLLAACLAVERGRTILAGLALAAACLLRYEAWAVLPAFALAASLRGRRSRRWIAEAWTVAIPALVIGAWIVLHERGTGEWLQFLRVNRDFARAARATAIPGVGPEPTLAWYPITLPYRNLGAAVLLAAPGLYWFFRHAPLTHRAVGPALLGFVTYGWVRQQHLGLDRHLFAVVPFYSTAVAGGLAQLVDLAARLAPRAARFWAFAPAALALYVGARTSRYYAVPHFEHLARVHAEAWVDERRAADLVKRGQPAKVFCDLPRVEVFSGLPPDRFVRWSVADVEPLHADGEAAVFGRAWIVSAPARFAKLGSAGIERLSTPEVRVVEWPAPR
jgi:hypothetical protein